MQLQPSNQLLPNALKRSDTLILLLSNAAKRSETSKQLLSNGAKRSETYPPKAQAQRIYIILWEGYLRKPGTPYLHLSLSLSPSQFHLELLTDRQDDSNVHGIVDGQNLLYIYIQTNRRANHPSSLLTRDSLDSSRETSWGGWRTQQPTIDGSAEGDG